MPWFRLDENVMDHPKFLALNANAWRLWCEGGSYCQKHLTDGLIPRAALKGFRYYSAASLKQLTSALVPDKGPLWHQTPEGIRVHDYLDYNDSRADVMKARSQGKERRRRYLDNHASDNASNNASSGESKTVNVSCDVVCSSKPQAFEEREGGSGETSPERAGNFCEWYADAHRKHIGVSYIGNPRGDYEAALRLVDKFSDAELRDAALVWFGQVDEFATRGTRSIPKFASRASDCVLQARRIA